MDNGESNYRRFLSGDDEGLTLIIKEYKDGLILYINSYVANIYVAEDLMQDTFFKIAVKKPKFKEESSFKTWLYTIGRNVALNYLKKKSKQKEVSIDDCGELVSQDNVEEAYIKEERKIVLHRCIGKLKPEYRQILWLVYFEDFSLKQVAAVMKISLHNAETLVYRARKALKTQLETEGFSYENL